MILSLRLRLILIILPPLLIISGIVGFWAVMDAQERANERFDRSLLSAVLAISRDVAGSGGDALSPETNAILRDTSGGRVFYHVYAPDGVFVTGYATPPLPAQSPLNDGGGQQFFDAEYFGEKVRVLRFTDVMQIEGLSGTFTFSVWQNAALRQAIVRDLSQRTFQVIATLVLAVALVVWFGVRIGLRPLLDLEAAIAQRSPDDLTTIKRKVPEEARGIVSTLNSLLQQVATTLMAKDVFISNAAHQLRNPIAGVVAMSEAVQSAKTLEDMRERSDELAKASRRAGDLANKLLTLERASARGNEAAGRPVDLPRLVAELCMLQQNTCTAREITLRFVPAVQNLQIVGDATMLGEAVTNLIENALAHAGVFDRLTVSVCQEGAFAKISVEDNGVGLRSEDIEKARSRFGQLAPSQGSGLGLAIADAVAVHHQGRMEIVPLDQGLRIDLFVPMPRA